MIRSVTPYLIVEGGHEAIDWYVEVFAAVEVARMTGAAGQVARVWLFTRADGSGRGTTAKGSSD